MKFQNSALKFLAKLVLFSSLAASTSLLAQSAPVVLDPAECLKQAPDLKAGMEKMDRIFKGLRSTYNDPKAVDANVANARSLSAYIFMARTSIPPYITSSIPAAKQAAAVVAYKAQMSELLMLSLQLEEAFLAKDVTKAGEALIAIKKAQNTGHEDFNPEP